MQANQAIFPVSVMAKVLKVSKSGFYAWLKRPLSQRDQNNLTLTAKIIEIHKESDSTYGQPRIRAELRKLGIFASGKRIARLMSKVMIQGVSRRKKYVATTKRDPLSKKAPDLVNRQFKATGPNQLWVADMTYIPTAAGVLYLAVVADVFSRKIVGWSFGERMTSDLVVNALNMALLTRRPKSVVHHSDQGSQYTSIAFGNRCKEMGVKPSMGSVGDAYDNAMAESFFATLECELINRRSWKTKQEARMEIFTWIEGRYNSRRIHSALDYQSPIEFERRFLEQQEIPKPNPRIVISEINS